MDPGTNPNNGPGLYRFDYLAAVPEPNGSVAITTARVGIMDLKLPLNPNFERGMLGKVFYYKIKYDIETGAFRLAEGQTTKSNWEIPEA